MYRSPSVDLRNFRFLRIQFNKFFLVTLFLILSPIRQSVAEDWPMWRHDPSRGAASKEALPGSLQLAWTLRLPKPQAAWPHEQGKIQFDASYEPVVLGTKLFVPSMLRDSITAYDTRNGEEVWRFYAGGPVRFAPVAHQDKVYFVSDDGYLYCVAAADGRLLWKVLGGPSEKTILGNDRLISMWPARGAPVLYDNKIYFAAGIWPFMGIFVHAVDAETGEIIWTNSGSGSNYLVQPHNSPAFAGIAPQGYLTATEDVLLVSGGMTVPAGFDRRTGEFLYYIPGNRSLGKEAGGYEVVAGKNWYVNRGGLYNLADGKALGRADISIVSSQATFMLSSKSLSIHDAVPKQLQTEGVDRKGKKEIKTETKFPIKHRLSLPQEIKTIHLRAGSTFYASDGQSSIFAIETPAGMKGDVAAKISWQAQVDGQVWRMIAADQRLFVVTLEGAIYCFSGTNDSSKESTAKKSKAKVNENNDAPQTLPAIAISNASPQVRQSASKLADEILKRTKTASGYAVVFGFNDGALVESLLKQSELNLIVIEPDKVKCNQARRRLDSLGLLGQRISLINKAPRQLQLPQYMANLVICQQSQLLGFNRSPDYVSRIFAALRPYGGVAILKTNENEHVGLAKAISEAGPNGQAFFGAKLDRLGDFSWLTRSGALKDSAPWTHNNADIGNSLVSLDQRVKTPLGLLWFGGPSNKDVLPRHGHGPSPQVVGGRLFIEGPDMLRAVDVYTGRLLWQREFKNIGLYYNNTGHHPGAGAIGGNYVSLEDGVYVVYGRECLRLDPATGKTVKKFELPADASGKKPIWGYLGVYENLLIAGSSPLAPLATSRAKLKDAEAVYVPYGEGSQRLVVMDRHSGKVIWSRDAAFNFRHNAIVAGDGKLFCIDRMTDARQKLLKRRGLESTAKPTLYALDAQSGKVDWQTEKNVFGTWLSFSKQHNLLLQAGSSFRDRGKDETGQGLAVYHSDSGKIVWESKEKYGGPCLLHTKSIISQGNAFDLFTGKSINRKHPLTGIESKWSFTRNYGCNTAIGCTNLLTFRSAAAGYFDLAADGGTGNLGGFRSSCTSNLIPADGLLNAPDYTKTCLCAYQNQCSLALVYMPDVEMWTFNSQKWGGQRVKNVGLNFGAPGDRRGPSGSLWLDYPSVGGPSPDIPVEVEGENIQYFRRHASGISGDGPTWIFASGIRAAKTIKITLAGEKDEATRKYTVRLYFVAIQGQNQPPRSLHISLQDNKMVEISGFNQQTAAENYGFMREFPGIEVQNQLKISLDSASGKTTLSGVEIVLEE